MLTLSRKTAREKLFALAATMRRFKRDPSPSLCPLLVAAVSIVLNRISTKLVRDHIKELNNVRPKKPFFFLKPPSSILLPSQGPLLRPQGVDLHYEVELACVIGRNLRDAPESDEKGLMEAIKGTVQA